MPSPAAESRATIVGKWVFAILVPLSALALGSLPTAVLVAMSALAALSCGLLWIRCDIRVTRASQWVLIGILVLLAMTILQAVPLPAAVVRAVAPANAAIWEGALAPLREPGPAWHTISVAPAATRVEVLRGAFYAAVFLSGLRVTTLEHGERFLVRTVVVSASLVAFTSLAHAAVHAEKVFGIYRPHELYAYQPGRFGPLLNTNHLAAYLNIGALVALGALLAKRSMPRALSGSAVLVLAATSVWQSSRGATGSLLFSVLLTFALTFYAKRQIRSARAETAILAACAVAATVIVTIALSGASGHLLSRDFGKADVAKSSLRLVAASPWVGVGRGGFESVFSAVREGEIYLTWTNPEDIVIQWLVEWGVPVSVGAFAVLTWALRPQIVLRAVRPPIGAWAAVLAAVLHELVDYHFEVPGITALVAVCVAFVVGGAQRSRGADDLRASSSVRLSALAVAFGIVFTVAFVLPEIGHTLAEDRRRLSESAVDKLKTRETFREEIRADMLRYPAEPFLPLMGAVRAQLNDESVIPWVARALERNPRFGRAHYVLARSLAVGQHAAQARLEYRLAYDYDAGLRDTVVREAVHVVDGRTAALELVPDGPNGVDMLGALALALAPRFPSTAVMLDEELERRSPSSEGPLRRRAEAAVSDAVTGAPWCAGNDSCTGGALILAQQLANRDPYECQPHVLVARLRIARGDVVPALDELERAETGVKDRAPCERQYISLAFEYGQTQRGDSALERIVRGGCGAAADCAQLYSWAASTEEGRGHYLRAIRLYRLVLEVEPEREDLLDRIGTLGAREGGLAEGLAAYTTLATRHPADPRWPAKMAELRAGAGLHRRSVIPSEGLPPTSP